MIYRYDGAPPSVTFLQQNLVVSLAATHTHSSISFGTAASRRRIIVCLAHRGNGIGGQPANVTSMTIGGVTATKIVEKNNAPDPTVFCAIWIANVPTGTSGNIVITYQFNSAESTICVYEAQNLNSSSATDTEVPGFSAPATLSVNVAARGIIVGHAYAVLTLTGSGATWTGLTENFDALVGTERQTTASIAVTGAETPRAITVTGFATTIFAVSASFR